ncbi:23S rRNA (uracil(1939)-C(5))-methyltransferase RlmD [Sedimenticola selenatireducens]|uniref:23S rRNA (uracil(1939)-C(5))-methyltransferase RlmD n=1 Tax=Sedimenticola selenatireducens TaxID=191960 RepID=A0A558DPX2_9GAMM|nr:23S rRNA (uracil(1939)-C(5))-methyltransferase RlmD [Sedimenticola selenatireducens]TVO70512.1 23S rRNA (uracil(1939)-C(5))-methyltransferase RlmD [Sedimenticola selenatireducens]TVT63089.1 MAG: 23S rRNA (uracil(1939)-C(5))-methyltransferase RlmD [Sedimenticola selenatireducens]
MGRSRRRKLPQDPVTVTIDALSHDGRGVAHIDGKAVFIHGALPGETVSFRYTRVQKKFDEGEAVEIIDRSSVRVEPPCQHFGLCGGCSLQHLSSEAQIEAKQQALLDAFQRIGKVTPGSILSPLTSGSTLGYRRKARLGAKYVLKKEKVLVGFRERGTPYVADLTRCEVLHPKVGQLIGPLSELIESLSIKERVPQIEMAMGDDQCILIFRLLSEITNEDCKKLLQFGQDHDIAIYTQTGGPETVTPLNGEPVELIYALPRYDLSIHFLPNDFTQVNSELNQLMLDRALALLALSPEDRVLDLFCGLGNFTLPMARTAAEVVGVEGDSGLVARARENAQRNGVTNTRFFTANLYESIQKEPWLREQFDKVLLDPPRSGAAEVLEHLPKLGAKRLVYVSCYPGTLARDAGELVHRYGYELVSAGVMDMFPHTAHVESIALFEKRK